ncbi:hypothetical protein QE410_001457 [Microbacterium sp. SORGH_AS 1204]|uniref:hypothetical protein n=1 Tax=Microbacterium sp. SORGH_AS_1204 TaxID=3041785 RepID=UPI00278D4ADB|nr:hypothetical protein [Microbacterium sp. SORGH_AS_1204]MDQ1136658.1 hypothetical protein [Microbacterium sp. SORGH_AS_1204]
MAAIVAALIGRIPVFFGAPEVAPLIRLIPVFFGAPELAPLVGWEVAAGVFLARGLARGLARRPREATAPRRATGAARPGIHA